MFNKNKIKSLPKGRKGGVMEEVGYLDLEIVTVLNKMLADRSAVVVRAPYTSTTERIRICGFCHPSDSGREICARAIGVSEWKP